jgi:hypothetical protein
VEKVGAIARHQVALDWLRVCWRNPKGAYNCGRCEKCLRTMISLHAAGAAGRCRTLPGQPDPRDVARMAAHDINQRVFLRENIKALEGRPGSEELLRALKACRRAERRGREVRTAAAAVCALGVRLPAPVKRPLRPLVRALSARPSSETGLA